MQVIVSMQYMFLIYISYINFSYSRFYLYKWIAQQAADLKADQYKFGALFQELQQKPLFQLRELETVVEHIRDSVGQVRHLIWPRQWWVGESTQCAYACIPSALLTSHRCVYMYMALKRYTRVVWLCRPGNLHSLFPRPYFKDLAIRYMCW